MFTVIVDRVASREEVVHGVMLCVQDFVRDPVFTQRSVFSETGVAMLSEAAAISDSITSSTFYAPSSEVESKLSGPIIADLETCFERALDRCRVVKDTSELCGRLLMNLLHKAVSGFQQSWKRGKLIICTLFLRPLRLLDIVVNFPRQEKEKRKCLGAELNCQVSLLFQVLLSVPESVLRLMFPLLLPPWHLSRPEEKHGKVGEIEHLRQFFKEECRNCYCLFGL